MNLGRYATQPGYVVQEHSAVSLLALKRLVVFAGTRRVYDERFHPGVNIIRGQNGSGKSTIADFIFFVLGGEFDQWKEKAKLCTEVRAEILTRSGVITLRRFVTTRKEPIAVFFGAMDNDEAAIAERWSRFPIQRSEKQLSFSQALFRAVGIPDAPGSEGSNVTAHQIMRLLYSDQRTPAPRLFRFESFDTRDIRVAVGDLILGVNSYALYETQIELRSARKKLESATIRLDAFRTNLPPNFGSVRLDQIDQEQADLEAEQLRHIGEIEALESIEMVDEDDEYASARNLARDALRQRRRLMRRLEEEVEQLALELDDLDIFVDYLEETLRKIGATSQLAGSIGSLEFSHCPNCLKILEVPDDGDHCIVCTRPFDSGKQEARYLEIQIDTSLQLRESRQLVTAKSQNVSSKNNELRRLRSDLRRARSEFVGQFELAGSPSQARIAQLHNRLGQIGELIKQSIGRREVAERFTRLISERDQADDDFMKLNARAESLSAQGDARRRRALGQVSQSARGILHSDLPRQAEFQKAEMVSLDFGDDAVSVDGSMNFAESSNVVLKNAALLALVGAASRDPEFWHPRFLLMDNVEDKGMELARSHRFQELIVAEAKAAITPIQIILTTSMPNPALERPDLVVGPTYSEELPTLNFSGVPPCKTPDLFAQEIPLPDTDDGLIRLVAAALGIDEETLTDHPFHVEEYASDDDLVYSWRLIWEDSPPVGVEVFGVPGQQWSEILPPDDGSDADIDDSFLYE